jgi:hypothetical protein
MKLLVMQLPPSFCLFFSLPCPSLSWGSCNYRVAVNIAQEAVCDGPVSYLPTVDWTV